MKLSDYVAFLNLLDNFDELSDYNNAVRSLEAMFSAIKNYQHQIENFSQRLDGNFNEIKCSLTNFSNTVKDLRSFVQQAIVRHENAYLQNSIRIYQSEMIHETDQYILNRRLYISDDDKSFLENRLKILSDWKYPGMIIRPGLEDFIKILVPLDPLYLVDQSLDLIHPSTIDFDELYQRRLRRYTINDYQSTPILKKLPDSQYSLIFAYNFFNYKPLSIFEQYLDEMYQKLRPGGTVILTYNNCDWAHSVRLAEQNFMMYTPYRLLKPIIDRIGYHVAGTRQCEGDTDIIELVKPGTLSSIRGGQCLAKIVAKY